MSLSGWENRARIIMSGTKSVVNLLETNNIGWAWWTIKKSSDLKAE